MSQPLRQQLLSAMSRATSQAPISTEVLAQSHVRKHVEAALNDLYEAHEANCCLITKNGSTAFYWWPVGIHKGPSNKYNNQRTRKKNHIVDINKMVDGL